MLPLEELLDYGPYDDNQIHALDEEEWNQKAALKLKALGQLGVSRQTNQSYVHKEIEAD